MNALIVLLAVVASTYADDAAQACFTQAEGFHQCVCKDLSDSAPKKLEVLKNFGKEIQECFKTAGAGCKMPTIEHGEHQGPLFPTCPAPSQGPPQEHPSGADNPKFDLVKKCIAAVNETFTGCVAKAGVELPKLPGGPGAFHGGPPPPGDAHPGASDFHDKIFAGGKFNEAEMKTLISGLCVDSSGKPDLKASRGLLACAVGVINKGETLATLFGLVEPAYAFCNAAEGCNKANAISGDCVTKFEGVRQAVCTCKTEVEAAVKDKCTDVKAPPPLPFDICGGGHPENKCADAKAQFDKIKGLLANFAAAPARGNQ